MRLGEGLSRRLEELPVDLLQSDPDGEQAGIVSGRARIIEALPSSARATQLAVQPSAGGERRQLRYLLGAAITIPQDH